MMIDVAAPAPLSYRQATRVVLVVGLDPAVVEGPEAVRGGRGAEAVRAGLAADEVEMLGRGWRCEPVFIEAVEQAAPRLAEALEAAQPDCVVIGSAARAPGALVLLETLLNVIHRRAPHAAIAFAARAGESAEAAERWM